MNSLVLIVVLAAFSVQLTVQSTLATADSFDADSFDPDAFDADLLLNEADLNDFAEDEDVTRSNLSLGTIGSGDKVLYRKNITKSALSNQVRRLTIHYRGGFSTRITAIRVLELNATQGATPSIRSGGIGKNFVRIMITSLKGRGFSYGVEVYGRKTA